MFAPVKAVRSCSRHRAFGLSACLLLLVGVLSLSFAGAASAANCMAVPSACGYPDATNTGVPSGTALEASGSTTVTTNGAILSGLDISGTVAINANNVTIKNSRITPTTSGSGVFAVTVLNGHTGTRIEDTTIRGKGSGSQTTEAAVRSFSGVTLERDNFSLCNECVQGGATVKDTYMVVSSIYSGAHAEDIYVCSETINVDHSTLINEQPQTATVFGDTICGGGNNFTVTNSLLAGGGFLVYPQANSGSSTGTMNVSNNRFARCRTTPVYNSSSGGTDCQGGRDANGLYPNGGYFGIAAYLYTGGANVWQNNVWDDSSQPVCPNGSSGCGATTPPPPPPDNPASAIWTTPTGATVGVPVTLDGSSSGGDAPLTCLWSIESQSGAVLDTKPGCTVSYTFAQAGTQYVKLTVTDVDGDSNSSRKSFAVGTTSSPPPPDEPADAVWTAPTGVTTGTPVVLDGSSSSGDPQLSCLWSFEDQSGAIVWETRSGCVLPFTFQTADTKYVKLTVTDGDGDLDSNRQSFAVTSTAPPPPPPPDNPASAIWTTPTGATVGVPVTLDGSSSGGDAPLTCLWSIESQSGAVLDTKPGCTVSYTFAQAGTQYVKLTVTDVDGDSNSSRKSFAVTAPAPPPPPPSEPAPSPVLPHAIWSLPPEIAPGQTLVLDGTASTGEPPLTCTWTVEDKSGSRVYQRQTGCKFTYSAPRSGTQYVRLMVRDGYGAGDSLRRAVTVHKSVRYTLRTNIAIRRASVVQRRRRVTPARRQLSPALPVQGQRRWGRGWGFG